MEKSDLQHAIETAFGTDGLHAPENDTAGIRACRRVKRVCRAAPSWVRIICIALLPGAIYLAVASNRASTAKVVLALVTLGAGVVLLFYAARRIAEVAESFGEITEQVMRARLHRTHGRRTRPNN